MIPIRKSRQSGFGVLELLISTAILTVLILISLPALQRYQTKTEAEAFRDQIVMVWDAIKSYQADRYNTGVPFNDIASLPASFADLSPDYIQSCSVADNEAGRCSRPDLTPMSELIEMARENVVLATGETVPGMLLTIPLGGEPSEQIRNTYRAVLADLPNGTYNENDNELLIRFGRIGSEVEHQALLARDGTTALTGDWDVGSFGITNVKDITLSGKYGKQIIISSKLSESIAVKHNEWVNKPICIPGQTPQVKLSIGSIDVDTRNYTLIGGMHPYILRETTSHWLVGIAISVKDKNSGKEVIINSGEVIVTSSCL